MGWRSLVIGAVVAVLAACAQPHPISVAPYPPDTALVVVNRTEAPIWMGGFVTPPCTQLNKSKADLDTAIRAILEGADPVLPEGTVDWSSLAINGPGVRPGFLLITSAATSLTWGHVDLPTLPPCEGMPRPLGARSTPDISAGFEDARNGDTVKVASTAVRADQH